MTDKNPYLPPQAALDDAPEANIYPDYGWNVARAQKALLVAVILQIGGVVTDVGWLIYLCGVGLSFWAVYNLGDALQTHKDGFSTGGGGKWLMLIWIPYVGVIALLILNGKATRFLKDAGYTVGLFGARRKLGK
ncbi:hypothetical protein [Pseudoduganella namucuonensis]|uniref:Uncharacterized protein n=1 Tax=Pseudoduganella namucuonensis TaxID=1035707 RepID=A0A1I7KS89_9BURK|nr:hypothetical protein [Pseudoduganella namucuonensis]SFV00342.1 hypothetical protein SAMN05216552_101937 [Pseudoduganella namucuonensis]